MALYVCLTKCEKKLESEHLHLYMPYSPERNPCGLQAYAYNKKNETEKE